MRNKILCFCSFSLMISLFSCSPGGKELIISEPLMETKTLNSSSKYCFNVSANIWMIEQEDPYELSRLKATLGEKSSNCDVSATHYALKIYPRNEEELEAIIHRKDIIVSYVPFGYTVAPIEETKSLILSLDNSYHVYREEAKYYVDYGEENGRWPLPVLYVAWSASTPLPSQYDYSLEYEAYLPNGDGIVSESDDFVMDSIYSLRGSSNRTLTGYIKDYDDLLGVYVPVKNLRVRLSYGLNSIETITNQNGYFTLSGNINDNATLQFVYENDKWRLANNSLFSYVEGNGTVSSIWGTGSHTTIYKNSAPVVLHRAANYFFNGNHGISTPPSSFSLRINMTSTNDLATGVFHAGILFSPWIDIDIDPDYYDDAEYSAHLLHELGHFNHYQINDGAANYINVYQLIKESYAEFISWNLCHKYYTEMNNNQDISSWDSNFHNANQYWKKTQESFDLGCYSPLFIDLVDNLNQNLVYGSQYNYDEISSVTPTIIPSLVEGQQTWSQMKNSISTFLNYYYSQSQINNYLAPYEYFISNSN